MFERFWPVRYFCPVCFYKRWYPLAFVRLVEKELDNHPEYKDGPPGIACDICDNSIMLPIKYRSLKGKVFKYSPKDF